MTVENNNVSYYYDKKVGNIWIDTKNKVVTFKNAFTSALYAKKQKGIIFGSLSVIGFWFFTVFTLGAYPIYRIYKKNKNKPKKLITYPFNQIIGYEILEDNDVVTKGGLGSAIVGGVAFGGAGAIVGAIVGKKNKKYVNFITLKINVNDFNNPAVYLRILDKPVKTNSYAYKEAYNLIQNQVSTLEVLLKNV